MWNRYSQITHQKNHTYHAQANLYGQSYFYQLKEAFSGKAPIRYLH